MPTFVPVIFNKGTFSNNSGGLIDIGSEAFEGIISLNAATIALLLLDEKGRMRWDKTIAQKKGASVLELRFPRLKPGKYNLWAETDGQVSILMVEVKSTTRKGLLQKMISSLMT